MFLKAENIVKQYANHRALDGVDIEVPEGGIYGLLGPNGAGKTTLIRIINRIIRQDSGLILFKGKPMSDKDVYKIGYLPEERGLYKKMKVWDHALFLAQLKGLSKKQATEQLNIWFDRFSITDWKNKKVEELSKGMQQKVQFLTTVIHTPDLLILDEPFSGFDPINAEILKNEILRLKAEGKTIILSTHNMESVEELCDRISLVNKSKIVLQGEVSDVKHRYKRNVLKLILKTNDFYQNSSSFDVISETKQPDNTLVLRIEKKDNDSNSDVVRAIAACYEILSFEEELPSMNDIFIQTVTNV